jgi:hypothetical protein
MLPAIVAGVGLVAVLVGICIGVIFTRARVTREQERLGAEQNNTVGLYLRRKIAETGADIDDLNLGQSFDDVLEDNRRMAERLLSRERQQLELGDTQEIGLASTMRLESKGELDVPVPKKD